MRKRPGEIKLCNICLTPKYKSRMDIENNRKGYFFCSRECLQNHLINQQTANKIAKEWS